MFVSPSDTDSFRTSIGNERVVNVYSLILTNMSIKM